MNIEQEEKSISENFQNDKEMSLLYNKGECRFIKNENDLKLFALRESYKSHLYKIRHLYRKCPPLAPLPDNRF